MYQFDVVSMHNSRNNNGIRELAQQRPLRGIRIQDEELTVKGCPNAAAQVIANNASTDIRDFDLSRGSNYANFIWPKYFDDSIDSEIRRYNFEQCIPMLGAGTPKPDIAAINNISTRVSDLVGAGKLYPTTTRSDYLSFLARNTANLARNIYTLPDKDCLYYKNIDGQQHLFLHISPQHAAANKNFQRAKAQNSICAVEGDVVVNSQKTNLVNASVIGDRVVFDTTNLLDQASKLQATEVLYIKADSQKHETIIEKWVRYSRCGSNYVHAEGIKSVNECELIAPLIVQDGDTVQNLGISVQSMCFEDHGVNTSNMPATIRLYNDSHAEKRGWFSKSVSHLHREDDFHIPTRYQVNYYRSLNVGGRPTSVKFGYTLIDAGSDITITKNDAQAIPVTERHVLEIHESSSGFSIFGWGKAKVPDPIGQLQAMHRAYEAGNMVGLTTSTISRVAKTIKTYEDIKSGISNIGNIGLASVLNVLSHFINGPSIQFGWRSVDIKHVEERTLGNHFRARNMKFHTDRVSFCGNYEASEDIDIKTKTLITFAMPHVIHDSVSMSSSGIQMDLLTFAIVCFNPEISGITSKALAASFVNANYQNTETHVVQNIPTTIKASRKLTIEAENGYITQAQIKAALIHAIFTNDCVIETLANEFKQSTNGGGFSMGLSAFNGSFTSFIDTLTDFAGQCTINVANSGRFERMIDEYASMIGTEEFYLKVGNILRTKSAFLGHEKHNATKEHIEFEEWQKNQIQELSRTWDNSFSISIGDLIQVASTIKKQCFSDAVALGMNPDEADKLASKKSKKEIKKLVKCLEDTEQALDAIDKETDLNLKKKIKIVSPKASEDEKNRIQRENNEILAEEIKQSAQKKKAIIANQLIRKIQEQSREEKRRYSNESKMEATKSYPKSPFKPERDQPNRVPLQPTRINTNRSSEERRRGMPISGEDGDHNRKIDPNTLNWATVPEGSINCRDVDWDKVKTREQADKIDITKVNIGLHDAIPDHLCRFILQSRPEQMLNRPPTMFDVLESINDSAIEPLKVSVDVLSGLWNYAKHVYDNPQSAVYEAKEYLAKCSCAVKDHVIREGITTLESLRAIIEYPDMFREELKNVANDPEPFVRKLMETGSWKTVRLHPIFASVDIVGGTYFDFQDASRSRKNVQPAVDNLRDRAISTYISDIAESLFGRRGRAIADVVMNFY